MKLLSILLLTLISTFSFGASRQNNTKKDKNLKVEFVTHESEKKIDVLIGGKLFTSYTWLPGIYKPVLYPICTSAGTVVTRGFPLEPRPGERADHRHQVGNWLNYGNVNGFDFWGNGHSGQRSSNGGEILHLKVKKLSSGNHEGTMITEGSWVDREGKKLLSEKTEYHFIASGTLRIIDRITTLTAVNEDISLNDTKEGMFAIRVARQLELPAEQDITVLDKQLKPTKEKAFSNQEVSGNYISSEGITGLKVWGTRSKWMNLLGNIDDEKISIVICDHPKNINYPTYWHARGYGLFSANPLGVKDFTKGKEELNVSIPAGKTITFRYRMIISSHTHLSKKVINNYAAQFAKRY